MSNTNFDIHIYEVHENGKEMKTLPQTGLNHYLDDPFFVYVDGTVKRINLFQR